MSGRSGLASALLLSGAVVLPVVGPGSVEAAAQSAFEAPSGPFRLTRELHRSLPRGQEIVTRRSYEIRIVRDGEGWRVDGQLVDSQIEAPPELAMLAELEKARKDARLFPLYLDRNGMIVQQHGGGDAASSAAAHAMVNSAIAKAPLTSGEQAVAADMVKKIVASSEAAGGNWPSDLFRPTAGRRSESHIMPLADGSQGRITVVIEAEGSRDGLLDHFARNVVTELAGTRRESRELFMLARGR
ncbi:MAG: hypothetical protein ABIW31_02350 [Novosphingobium sp.]